MGLESEEGTTTGQSSAGGTDVREPRTFVPSLLLYLGTRKRVLVEGRTVPGAQGLGTVKGLVDKTRLDTQSVGPVRLSYFFCVTSVKYPSRPRVTRKEDPLL